ncbi:MAG: hypothetical protein AAGD22_17320 [Verrucomicrobiota bacterium]
MKTLVAILLVMLGTSAFGADKKAKGGAAKKGVEQINNLIQNRSGKVVHLRETEHISTKERFKPPVEIIIVAKTDSTNLRLGYAADQMIFNWKVSKHQLRVDGGPADDMHRMGKGLIPTFKYVTFRWVVTPTKQEMYVDDELRFSHVGDYSTLNEHVSVYSNDSNVSVKSITVRQLEE